MVIHRNKIGILGLGAIGSVLSYELLQNKQNDLLYFNRSKKDFLKLKSNAVDFEAKIKVETSPSFSIDLDWLIVCLKEHQYDDAHLWFSHLIHPDLNIVLIRNGVHLRKSLKRYSTHKNILECMIDCPTEVHQHYYESLSPPIVTTIKSSLATKFISLFNENQIKINKTDDFRTECWKKLCESSALGGILCLSGETCWVFKDELMRDLYKDLLIEHIQVAKADGAIIEDNYVSDMLEKLVTYPDTKGSSMLTDRINGNPIELGAKNGIISTLGKEYGIETPINDLIVKLLTHTNSRT